MQKIDYEWIPAYCNKCKKLGHRRDKMKGQIEKTEINRHVWKVKKKGNEEDDETVSEKE